jgi:2-dehydro-3-deoxygalactonokinase
MRLFISCDWGTSTFRLRLVDKDNQQVLAEVTNQQGIAATFEEWKNAGGDRLAFYRAFLGRQMDQLQAQAHHPLKDLPVILSGMASSGLGMMELPYKTVPFGMTGEDLGRISIPPVADFPHQILLVSGVRTADDVMRGEEVQLVGCLPPTEKEGRMYLFPGTHSKHVWVSDGQALGFTTYMTGEFFHLLSTKSVLAGSVSAAGPATTGSSPAAGTPSPASLSAAFDRGVKDSVNSSLLHNSFLVRTNQLFGRWSGTENYNYLSGLLIGEELKQLANLHTPVTVVSTGPLAGYYQAACGQLGVTDIKTFDADQALIKGHCKLLDL